MLDHTKVRKLRTEKKIKQEVAANFLGLSQGNYAKIENGQQQIKLEALEKLAKLLEVSVDDLLEKECKNMQYNSNNQNVNNQAFYSQDMESIKAIYQLLLSEKDRVIATKDEIITIKDEKIAVLEREISELKK